MNKTYTNIVKSREEYRREKERRKLDLQARRKKK